MSPKKHWHSRGKKLLSNIMAVAMLTGAAVVGVGAGGAGVASATLPGSSFNGLDGVLDVTNANHTVTDQTDPVDGADTTNYTGGPKENDFCPTVGTGQAPNKTDLDHLYLGVEHSGNDVFAYLGWHRFTADGTATIDFELNQSTSTCNVAGNGLNPIRTEGDLLITYDFQGGAQVAINARLWVGTAQTGHWGTAQSLDSTIAEASFGTPLVNPDELFGEAVVNLAKVKGFFSPDICKNVSSVYAKSRTGSDAAFDTASIKDFTTPIFQSISNCGSLKIIKTDDAGAALAGAAFELFKDNNGVIGATTGKTCTTVLDNSNPPKATCTIPNLFPGTYWVHETSVPAGYTKAPDTKVSITVDHTTSVTLEDPRIPGAVKITKTDDTGAPLTGATFGLFTDNNGAIGSAVAGKSCTTALDNSNPPKATCTISNILPPGTYWLRETTTPAGFSSVADTKITIALNTTTPVTLADPRQPGAVKIIKTDDVGAALVGATFGLFTDNNNAIGSAVAGKSCTTVLDNSNPPKATCTISDILPTGTYWLHETTVPAGHDGAPDTKVTTTANHTTEVTLVDPRQPGAVKIIKTDDTGAALVGASFGLFTDNNGVIGSAVAGKSCTTALDNSNPPKATCTISDILPAGTYWLHETTVPAGFDPAPDTKVSVALGQTTTVTLGDPRQSGSVDIVKVDDANAPVVGATFDLFTDNNGVIGSAVAGESCTTALDNSNPPQATCTISGILPAGAYWVHESVTPVGYNSAPDTKVSVTQGQTTSVTLTDPRKPNGIALVKSVNGNSATSAANPLVVEKGSTLDYNVTITNTGQVALTVGSLDDTLKANLPASCTQGLGSTLAPGASFTCTYSSTAAVPPNNGQIVNTASVGATDQFGRPVSASDSRQVQVLDPAINIVKAGPGGAHVGDKITYTLTVTNPGNTGLTGVAPTDPKCDAAPALVSKTGGNQDNVLDTNETWVFNCVHTVVSGDGNEIVNTATVTGVDPLLTKVTSKSSHTTPVIHPAIAIAKSANPTSANPGQTVVYTYTVTNPGDTALSTVGVTDDKCSPVTFVGGDTNGDAQLNVDETWTFTCSNTASSTGGDNTNVGTATGIDRLGQTVTAQASATITVVLAEVIAKQLPFTGSKTGRMLMIATLLLLAGLFFYLGGARLPRRKEQ